MTAKGWVCKSCGQTIAPWIAYCKCTSLPWWWCSECGHTVTGWVCDHKKDDADEQ